MPCCSFHMLLSHRQPHSGALLQLCSGFVLLKGRYCCLLRVQHLYVSLSGVYPDDVKDTDKFHFPSMFSRVYWTSKPAPISCLDWRLFPLSFPVWEQGDWCTGHWALPGACCPPAFPSLAEGQSGDTAAREPGPADSAPHCGSISRLQSWRVSICTWHYFFYLSSWGSAPCQPSLARRHFCFPLE